MAQNPSELRLVARPPCWGWGGGGGEKGEGSGGEGVMTEPVM